MSKPFFFCFPCKPSNTFLSVSIFILEIDPSTKSFSSIEVPLSLLSFTRLILFDSEWERSKIKGKPPRPKLDVIALSVIKRALEKREEDYSTPLEVSLFSRLTIAPGNFDVFFFSLSPN